MVGNEEEVRNVKNSVVSVTKSESLGLPEMNILEHFREPKPEQQPETSSVNFEVQEVTREAIQNRKP